MRKNKNILKKGMILAAVSTMVVTVAPAIPACAYGEADAIVNSTAIAYTDNSMDVAMSVATSLIMSLLLTRKRNANI